MRRTPSVPHAQLIRILVTVLVLALLTWALGAREAGGQGPEAALPSPDPYTVEIDALLAAQPAQSGIRIWPIEVTTRYGQWAVEGPRPTILNGQIYYMACSSLDCPRYVITIVGCGRDWRVGTRWVERRGCAHFPFVLRPGGRR